MIAYPTQLCMKVGLDRLSVLSAASFPEPAIDSCQSGNLEPIIFAETLFTGGGQERLYRFWYLTTHGRQHLPWYAALKEPEQNAKGSFCPHCLRLEHSQTIKVTHQVKLLCRTRWLLIHGKKFCNATLTPAVGHSVRIQSQKVSEPLCPHFYPPRGTSGYLKLRRLLYLESRPTGTRGKRFVGSRSSMGKSIWYRTV